MSNDKPKLVSINNNTNKDLDEYQKDMIDLLETLLKGVKDGGIIEISVLYKTDHGYFSDVAGAMQCPYETLYHIENILPEAYKDLFLFPSEEEE